MATPLIIVKADFAGRIELPNNMAIEKYNQHILHAEDFDLCKLMGDKFYYYFISNFETNGTIKTSAPQSVKDLYNGSSYVVNDIPYANPGIKPVLIYFTGSRLIKGIGEHITPNSFATKINEYSEPVSNSSKAFKANEYENQAIAYWNKCLLFMRNNADDFPQFYDVCGCEDNRSNGKRPTMIAVGGCDNNYYYRRNGLRRR